MSQYTFPSVLVSLAFLMVNAVVLRIILALNRQAGPSSPDKIAGVGSQAAGSDQTAQGEKALAAADILGWEFEYARVTASEANAERHTMVNFYLLIVGVAASGVIAVMGGDTKLPTGTGTVLLWLLCGIGWLYFLSIVRLRQAWYDSAQAMNQIKGFCIEHAKELDSKELRRAFRWKDHTLPAPGKPWTVYFYAAMVVALLNTAAYVAGGILIDRAAISFAPLPVLGTLALFGLAFFAFHVWLYFEFLGPKKASGSLNP